MIHIRHFYGYSEDDCISKINQELKDEQIINVVPKGSKKYEGYDEYDTWTEFCMVVIYKDLPKNKEEL